MDIRDLTDQQVSSVINELKRMIAFVDLELLNTPFGKYNSTTNVLSQLNKIPFKLDIHRGNKESDRFTINLRFTETNDCLVRLDIKGGSHSNPDGTLSPESHIHIYNNNYDKRDSYAHPVNLNDFPNINSLYNASFSFLDYTNIKNS